MKRTRGSARASTPRAPRKQAARRRGPIASQQRAFDTFMDFFDPRLKPARGAGHAA